MAGWLVWMLAIVVLASIVTRLLPDVQVTTRLDYGPRAALDVLSIVSALDEYALRHDGQFPESLDALVTPDARGYRCLNSKTVPRDPWKRAYAYSPPLPGADAPEPHVWSVGADGISGNDDDVDSRTMDVEHR